MVRGFEEIQASIDKTFQDYIRDLLRLDDQRLKYYYWTVDFFKTVGGLSFRYCSLTQQQKERINAFARGYFDDLEIVFEVSKSSHRNELSIRKITKLFSTGHRRGQTYRYEYIKEYVLWQLIEEIAPSSDGISKEIVDQQKDNFLLTYLTYLIKHTDRPSYPQFNGYIRYTLTNQGEELGRKLRELDQKHIYNPRLRDKLDRLYVHKDEEARIHFIFSRQGGAEKEELRELLDVMGREDTGKLYRGQADATWPLNASLTREPRYIKNESEMYYDILSMKPDAFANDDTVYERLITMQHFGMPTRLMDITRNPLVAIFFACNNLDRSDSDGAVFTFYPDPKDFLNFEDNRLEKLNLIFNKSVSSLPLRQDLEEDDFLYGISFIKGVAKNQRINNQSGDFIFVGKGKDIEERLHHLPSITIVIDAPTKRVLLEQLESLNIHGGAVYPDLTHMSNYIRKKYLIETKLVKIEDLLNMTYDEVIRKSRGTRAPERTADSSKIERLTTRFESDKFWTNARKKRLTDFAHDNNLNQKATVKIIEDLVAFDKHPIRSDVAKIMNPRPSFKDYRAVVQPVIDRIIDFAAELDNDSAS